MFHVNLTNNPLTGQQITQAHRQQGYVARYFVARANRIHNEVFEVNRREYEKHSDDSYVLSGHLNWIIKGLLEDHQVSIYTGNPTFDGGREPINVPGVLTQNRGAVRFLSRKIPAVKDYLTNYEEFHRGVDPHVNTGPRGPIRDPKR